MSLCFTDSHIHVADIPLWHPVEGSPVCSCAHSPEEFLAVEKKSLEFPGCVLPAFGVHPQKADIELIPFLEQLLREDRICAVGEAGFDLYRSEFAYNLSRQEEAWALQLELAVKYSKPLVVHCRRALDRLYPFCRQLSLLPAVVFHSFPGSPAEAKAFLKRRVNGYFSLGKQLLNGNKRAALCAAQLPAERLLLETDAPFQTLKKQSITRPEEIVDVYRSFACLRNEGTEQVCEYITRNFFCAFGCKGGI